MNKFYRVSDKQFKLDWDAQEDRLIGLWATITLPKRATAESAGYDFFAPFDFSIAPGEEVTIPTGIKVQLDPGYFLMIVPRSGLGFKYQLCLANTMGIIDGDYFENQNNEGHILVKLVNRGDKDCYVERGKAFCQGIILPYSLTVNDNVAKVRVGGIGSTSHD